MIIRQIFMFVSHLLVGYQCCSQHLRDSDDVGDDQDEDDEDEEEKYGGDVRDGRQEG